MQTREIEDRLMECPDVREVCAVLNAASPYAKPRVHVFVVLGKDTPITREYLQAHCNIRFRKSGLTMDLRVVDRLPRTPVGTVSRNALAALMTGNT